nr:hypothetical protein [Tanacetum cinerariifolium]
VAAWSKKKGRFLAEMVIPFFEGKIPVARLTPDDNEARSDWWISSRAYFDGFIDQVERVPFDLSRQNMNEIPSDIYRQIHNRLMLDNIMGLAILVNSKACRVVCLHLRDMLIAHFFKYGYAIKFSNPNAVPSHIGMPNLQTTIETQLDFDGLVDQNISNREKRQQLPSMYLVTPFKAQPPTTMVPKQRVSKNKNKGKKANLSPVNLGGVLEGHNE